MRIATALSAPKRLSFRAAALLLAANALAACNSTPPTEMALFDNDYRRRHPILISEEPESLDLPVGMRGGALSPEVVTAIHAYVADYRAAGTGAITLQVPTDAANEIAAAQAGSAVHQVLLQAGVAPGLVRVSSYPVGDRKSFASLRLSYLRVKAVTPRCGTWPEDVTPRMEDQNYYNFGCATQQNLAAMVANPADFIRPRGEEPANGARRAKVITDYQKGEDTKSKTTLIESEIGGQ